MKVADIHCHILPGVDDGSRDMEQTMRMIKTAYEEDIRLIIATPHYHIGKVKVNASVAMEYLEQVKANIKDKYPDLKLYLGQEIYYYSEAMEDVDSGRAGTMASSSYVLMEFSQDVSFIEITDAVYDAISHGYSPVLAHIERYGCLFGKYDRIEKLVESGAYLQVNAGSVAGKHGHAEKSFIKKLLKKQYISFVATDAHNDTGRAPIMSEAVRTMEKICKPDYLLKVLWTNPLKIIDNEEI